MARVPPGGSLRVEGEPLLVGDREAVMDWSTQIDFDLLNQPRHIVDIVEHDDFRGRAVTWGLLSDEGTVSVVVDASGEWVSLVSELTREPDPSEGQERVDRSLATVDVSTLGWVDMRIDSGVLLVMTSALSYEEATGDPDPLLSEIPVVPGDYRITAQRVVDIRGENQRLTIEYVRGRGMPRSELERDA